MSEKAFTLELENEKTKQLEIPEGYEAILDKAEVFDPEPDYNKKSIKVDVELMYYSYEDEEETNTKENNTKETYETNTIVEFPPNYKKSKNLMNPLDFENKPKFTSYGPGKVRIFGAFIPISNDSSSDQPEKSDESDSESGDQNKKESSDSESD